MIDKELLKNGSGYNDPTAYEAIVKIEGTSTREKLISQTDDYDRYMKVIGCILRICELSDFHLEERLVLKDKRTGKLWR